MKSSTEVPQKIKNITTIHPAILLLGIYPKKMKTLNQKYICTPTFTAVLLTIAKIRQQPNCPLIDEWITKLWHIYVEYNIIQS